MANISALPPALVVPTSGSWYGNDGSWSTFTIAIGNPPQQFAVLPATNFPNTWVPIADDCKALNLTDCGMKRGVYPFNSAESPGFQRNQSSSWEDIGTGLFKLGQNDFLGYIGNGQFGYDVVGLIRGDSSQTIQINHTAVTAYASADFWLGEIGLGSRGMNLGQGEDEQPSSFLTNLRDGGNIPSLSYGYTAGAPYRLTKIPASLTLGGYDAGRTTENLKIDINDDDDRPLTVAIQKISVTNALTGDAELSSSPFLVPIDSSVTDLWLPKSVCDEFEAAFGLQYNEQTNRYILENKNHTKLQEQDPVLHIIIGSQLKDGSTTSISFPYSAFDLQASYPIFADTLNYFPIRRAANSSQYIIGRVFLQEVYLTVDYERKYFNVSQANYSASSKPESNIVAIEPVNMPTDNSADETPSDPTEKKSLSGGVIAGIAIGAVVGIVLLVSLIWFLYIKPKREKRYELEGGSDVHSATPMKQGNEIDGNELAELAGGGGPKAEMPGEQAFPVETEDEAKRVHEMPTPVYELPTPFPELPTPDS